MSTTTLTAPVTTGTTIDLFEIVEENGLFYVTRNGMFLTNRYGRARSFITRNTARKRISRERRGDFHA